MQVSKEQLEQLKQDVNGPSSTRGQGFQRPKSKASATAQPGALATGINNAATQQAKSLKTSVATARQEFDALADAATPAVQELIDGTYFEHALVSRLTPVQPKRFEFGAFTVPNFGKALPAVDVDALFLPSGSGSTD
ncbi:MAG: hypothetical protein AAF921_16520 [Cyanobacteria bacterium P01_D01_bin.44]